jgi:hypothetical protein
MARLGPTRCRSDRAPRPDYVEDTAGRIPGLDALRSDNDLRDILIVGLETRIS